MRFTRLTYRVLCVGVNHDLRFAQKDAVDMARFLMGPAGVVEPEDVTCLLEPTVDELRAALDEVVAAAPTHFLFFFSGHGAPVGISLRDAIMGFDELADWIASVGADHTFTILDTCHAGAFVAVSGPTTLGAIVDDSLDLLASATPSNRVICSSAAGRLSGEGHGVANGHFTAALLAAMQVAAGDLKGRVHAWISDRRLYDHAHRLLTKRWRQVPVARCLTGDFPVVRDHRRVFGAAAITGASVVDGGLELSFTLSGRFGLPTQVRVQLLNAHRKVLATFGNLVTDEADDDGGALVYTLPSDRVVLDPISQRHLLARGAVPVIWRVSILDARGRVLAGGDRVAAYAADGANAVAP
ncbi:MAG: caspase family protein [Kofleriaceae bacterium]|nr:MAG: caspase family protein [Kofleriaceae bacterium]MBZ0237988.1 caspase family protein [Kofleriaceae bacterium]